MRLNHINLCSSDVSAVADFLVSHFNYSILDAGHVPADAKLPHAGAEFSMLEGSDGSSIVVTQIASNSQHLYPVGFHFGITMDTAEDVRFKHDELTEAGFRPEQVNGFEALGFTWTAFYCPLGDGLKLEVNHRRPSRNPAS